MRRLPLGCRRLPLSALPQPRLTTQSTASIQTTTLTPAARQMVSIEHVPESGESPPKNAAAGERLSQFDMLCELSTLLNTGLSKETLKICTELVEEGINPEALAAVVKEIQKQCVGESLKSAS